MAATPRLDALRREIDDLDDRMHDLLIRRTELAGEIGESKRAGAGGEAPRLFRPGREARVLRRLLARHRGPLPAIALQGIWRGIIAANLLLQGRVRVAVAGGEDVRALARDHFGPLVPLRAEPDSRSVLEGLRGGASEIAVLPFPPADADDPWWPGIGEGDPLRAVARIPLLAESGGPAAALVTASSEPEPSGDDMTLVSVAGPGAAEGAAALAEGAGLRAQVLAARGADEALLEVEGFEADAHGRIAEGASGSVRAVAIGAFAAATGP